MACPEYYCRLSCEEYSTAHDDLLDNFIHLTNVAIQRKHPKFKERMKQGDVVWSRAQFEQHVQEEGHSTEQLWDRIRCFYSTDPTPASIVL